MKTELTISIEAACPTTPSFIKTSAGMVSVGDVSEYTLKAIGAEWTKQLLEKARRRRGKAF